MENGEEGYLPQPVPQFGSFCTSSSFAPIFLQKEWVPIFLPTRFEDCEPLRLDRDRDKPSYTLTQTHTCCSKHHSWSETWATSGKESRWWSDTGSHGSFVRSRQPLSVRQRPEHPENYIWGFSSYSFYLFTFFCFPSLGHHRFRRRCRRRRRPEFNSQDATSFIPCVCVCVPVSTPQCEFEGMLYAFVNGAGRNIFAILCSLVSNLLAGLYLQERATSFFLCFCLQLQSARTEREQQKIRHRIDKIIYIGKVVHCSIFRLGFFGFSDPFLHPESVSKPGACILCDAIGSNWPWMRSRA